MQTTVRFPAGDSAQKTIFGTLEVDGHKHDVHRYSLSNGKGYTAEFLDLGARLLSFLAPSATGPSELLLQYDTLAPMYSCGAFYGCTVGRYANRIAGGHFSLEGETYTLAVNNGANHLHGGLRGFDKYIWSGRFVSTSDSVGVVFTMDSPSGDEGYPGALHVTATYTLTADNVLVWDFKATTDKTTIVNMTNHSYWNLSGNLKENDISGHVLQMNCQQYLPSVDMIPTGELRDVRGTPFDFLAPKTLGPRLQEITETGKPGLDHCFVVPASGAAAVLIDPVSKHRMTITTNQPGMQVYTANWLDGPVPHTMHRAVAFEPQAYPDTPNKSQFPSCVLRPGEEYHHHTEMKFDFAE